MHKSLSEIWAGMDGGKWKLLSPDDMPLLNDWRRAKSNTFGELLVSFPKCKVYVRPLSKKSGEAFRVVFKEGGRTKESIFSYAGDFIGGDQPDFNKMTPIVSEESENTEEIKKNEKKTSKYKTGRKQVVSKTPKQRITKTKQK